LAIEPRIGRAAREERVQRLTPTGEAGRQALTAGRRDDCAGCDDGRALMGWAMTPRRDDRQGADERVGGDTPRGDRRALTAAKQRRPGSHKGSPAAFFGRIEVLQGIAAAHRGEARGLPLADCQRQSASASLLAPVC